MARCRATQVARPAVDPGGGPGRPLARWGSGPAGGREDGAAVEAPVDGSASGPPRMAAERNPVGPVAPRRSARSAPSGSRVPRSASAGSPEARASSTVMGLALAGPAARATASGESSGNSSSASAKSPVNQLRNAVEKPPKCSASLAAYVTSPATVTSQCWSDGATSSAPWFSQNLNTGPHAPVAGSTST